LEGKYEKWKEEIQENVGKRESRKKEKVKRAKMQKEQNYVRKGRMARKYWHLAGRGKIKMLVGGGQGGYGFPTNTYIHMPCIV
jgi:ATPase subunit of ABC transporter with duplicated ATPase domains